jgi:hypothetical protein
MSTPLGSHACPFSHLTYQVTLFCLEVGTVPSAHTVPGPSLMYSFPVTGSVQ